MLLMISMPSAEQMKGIQSTKVMWTSPPLYGDLDQTLASMKKKKPSENWKGQAVSMALRDPPENRVVGGLGLTSAPAE